MGWDAFTKRADGSSAMDFDRGVPAFVAAAEAIKAEGIVIDGLLPNGGLDVSTCAQALERATGRDCWDEAGWSVETVRELALTARWDFDWPPTDEWARHSARAFLETAAALGLGVEFSW